MMTALIVLGCLVGVVIYGQIGWMLGNWWTDRYGWTDSYNWDGSSNKYWTAVLWPAAGFWLHGIWPLLRGIGWLIAAPWRAIEVRQERKKEEEHVRKHQRGQAKVIAEREAATAASPASEIAKLNEDLVRIEERRAAMLARKAELERHPDATRH